jgi:hypothetical protein
MCSVSEHILIQEPVMKINKTSHIPVISYRSNLLRLKWPSSRITTDLPEIKCLSSVEKVLTSYVDRSYCCYLLPSKADFYPFTVSDSTRIITFLKVSVFKKIHSWLAYTKWLRLLQGLLCLDRTVVSYKIQQYFYCHVLCFLQVSLTFYVMFIF